MSQNPAGAQIDITHVDLDSLTHHTELPQTRLSIWVDRCLCRIGELLSWVWTLLMAVIILNVFMRYALGEGRIEFEELQWHLYAVGWLFGLSYCFVADDHVRVDLIHHRLSIRAQAWIELLGILLLLIPFLSIVLWYAVPFVAYSWEMQEVSGDPGGLPFRWLIKSALFIGFALLALATLSRLSRVICLLFVPRAQPSTKPATA